MVFALETFWPSADGWSAARIEEEVVVTKNGPEVITRFPAEELMVAGLRYHTATGPLSATRETQSHSTEAPMEYPLESRERTAKNHSRPSLPFAPALL